jgi:hypothetical protein
MDVAGDRAEERLAIDNRAEAATNGTTFVPHPGEPALSDDDQVGVILTARLEFQPPSSLADIATELVTMSISSIHPVDGRYWHWPT